MILVMRCMRTYDMVLQHNRSVHSSKVRGSDSLTSGYTVAPLVWKSRGQGSAPADTVALDLSASAAKNAIACVG